MRKLVLLLAALLAIPWLAGCEEEPVATTVNLEEQFSLGPGESAAFAGEDLALRFVRVISDSRCPQGAICFWAGEVSCELEINYANVTNTKVLVQPGLSGPSSATFADYDIAFDVLPYPEVGKEIQAGDYRLVMTVSRQPALSGGILATFDVLGEIYSIFITNPETIDQVLALQIGQGAANIPSGRVLRGAVPYNEPWSWHIDPEDIEMAEITIELCDGTPSMVEENLDYWVETVQRFCPWQAALVNVVDYR